VFRDLKLAVMGHRRAYALDDIEESGLGESDFRVLEVLLHKGPMSVNCIGPKVNLNPGSVSVAVDRLYMRGLVDRVEDARDLRARIVSTAKGKIVIHPVFERHVQVINEVFGELKASELEILEVLLRRVGKHAEELHFDKQGRKKA
jgi:MarR family 2-MHQ and catechol resistance regulon transcriptional repressor